MRVSFIVSLLAFAIQDMFLGHAEESFLQSLFVEIVADETDRPGSDEEAVTQVAIDIHSDVFITHLECDHHIDQHSSDMAIDIEDKVCFLLRGELFDCESEVERCFLEWICTLSQEFTSTIRIVDTLDLMTNTGDDDALFFH